MYFLVRRLHCLTLPPLCCNVDGVCRTKIRFQYIRIYRFLYLYISQPLKVTVSSMIIFLSSKLFSIILDTSPIVSELPAIIRTSVNFAISMMGTPVSPRRMYNWLKPCTTSNPPSSNSHFSKTLAHCLPASLNPYGSFNSFHNFALGPRHSRGGLTYRSREMGPLYQ